MTRRSVRFSFKVGFLLTVALATNIASAPAWAGLSGSDGDSLPQVVAASAPASNAELAAAPVQALAPNFDGRWIVHSSPGCLLSATSIATVSHGKIRGPGYSGTISQDGTVHSSGRGLLFITFVSSGYTTETQGSGTFRESDGCAGTWSSHKL
jgi:hypothetical protein